MGALGGGRGGPGDHTCCRPPLHLHQRHPGLAVSRLVTNRVGPMIELYADHRRHAICELDIRDLKAGAGLAHLPSGQFNANAAWLLAGTLAHNLMRWTATLGIGVGDQQTVAKTLRRTLLVLPGRLTRSARRWRLHLPAGRAVGPLVHHGAGAAALHPLPDLTAGRHHRLAARPAPTAPACPPRRGKDYPAAQPPAPDPHPPPSAARRHATRAPASHPGPRQETSHRIRGSVDPGSRRPTLKPWQAATPSSLAQVGSLTVIPQGPTAAHQTALNGMPSQLELPKPYWSGLSGRWAVIS
jgi:hypothetical protein